MSLIDRFVLFIIYLVLTTLALISITEALFIGNLPVVLETTKDITTGFAIFTAIFTISKLKKELFSTVLARFETCPITGSPVIRLFNDCATTTYIDSLYIKSRKKFRLTQPFARFEHHSRNGQIEITQVSSNLFKMEADTDKLINELDDDVIRAILRPDKKKRLFAYTPNGYLNIRILPSPQSNQTSKVNLLTF
jgi:hypothetical protein